MITGNIILYLGVLLSVLASIYLIFAGYRWIGFFFIVGLFFYVQSMLYMQFIGHPEDMGKCWVSAQDYYNCLPLAAKISMVLGQASWLPFAVGIFLIVKHKAVAARGS